MQMGKEMQVVKAIQINCRHMSVILTEKTPLVCMGIRKLKNISALKRTMNLHKKLHITIRLSAQKKVIEE